MRTLHLVVSCLVLCLSCHGGSLTSQVGQSTALPGDTTLLERQVQGFQADSVCLLDALLLLGRQERVPFAIESLSRSDLDKHVNVRTPPGSLRATIDAIMAPFGPHSFSVEDGVISLHADDFDRQRVSFLDLTLPKVAFSECTLQAANNLVWMTFDQQIHPEHQGYAGSFYSGRVDRTLAPADIIGKTLRQVLTYLVARYTDAAWIALPLPDKIAVAQAKTDNLWAIIQYDDRSFEGRAAFVAQELRSRLAH